MDHGGETFVHRAGPHGDPFEFLEFLEEILDEVAPFVFFGVVACRVEAFGSGRNNRFDPALAQEIAQPIGIDGTVIVSDDAGQFNVSGHALCWVHAERPIHKPDTLTEHARKAKSRIRTLIWWLHADLKACRAAPALPPSTANWPACMPAGRNCCVCSTGRASRSTPHQRFGKRYPLPDHPPQAQRHHPQRQQPRRP
ncbi:MAG: hypothetical protein K2Q10_14170 [Rhodospirillales bacterium]|nr:hypothetical protein [Rhodospirillales bacterium]